MAFLGAPYDSAFKRLGLTDVIQTVHLGATKAAQRLLYPDTPTNAFKGLINSTEYS